MEECWELIDEMGISGMYHSLLDDMTDRREIKHTVQMSVCVCLSMFMMKTKTPENHDNLPYHLCKELQRARCNSTLVQSR